MDILIEKLDSIAVLCRQAVEDMSDLKVVEVGVDRIIEQPDDFPIAVTIAFRSKSDTSEGLFVLAFSDFHEASILSESIGRRMLGTAASEIRSDMEGILSEFLNVVAGRIISHWDGEGLFFQMGIPEIKKRHRISLRTQVDHVLRMIVRSEGEEISDTEDSVLHLHVLTRQSRTLEGKKILIVDDSKVMRSVISAAFKKEGATVSEAGSGEEGYKVHRSFYPDICIMDINLPGIDGFTAIDRIRDKAPRSRFIILSSSSKKEEIIKAKLLKVNAYMVKPPDLEELIERAAAAIEGRD